MSYIWHLIANIGYFLLFVNLVLFSIRLGTGGKANKIFTVYLLVILVIQLISGYLSSLRINNLFLSHFYFLGQFVFLSLFYKSLFTNSLQRKIINIGFVSCFAILGIQYSLDSSLLFKFNLFEIFLTSFILIIYSVFYFYNMLTAKKQFYYINIGIMLYLFGSTILFFVGNLTALMSAEMSKITWVANALLYVIYQLFISFEWYKTFSKKAVLTLE
ncbi:hypothetical protein [Flavobacterium degerlachei]|jgi:hypothetical protein|uniref:YhhN-like protein n=1 Tax=Flavobacterium degerlachei TaxID=229203 RepID=A0A1H3GC30_9FLAO|nr:hypothetical protein [Flavobacterium degerlachei]SDY00054.1 hypothetical protein SAMN05444338_12117 [Flavobacterium degerlachei]